MIKRLSKDQKISKLKGLGVELTGDEKVKDLDELLAKFQVPENTQPIPENTPIEEIEQADEVQNIQQAENEKKSGKTVVRFIHPEYGLTDREFTRDVHGENYYDTAKKFAEKFDGVIDPED